MNSLQNGLQRILKHIKTLTSLIKREMQIKTLVRCYFSPILLARVTKCENTVSKGLKKQVFLVDTGVNWSKLCAEPLAVLIKIANICIL